MRKQTGRKSPRSGITADIKFVGSLDSEVCASENSIYLDVLSSGANVYCEHCLADRVYKKTDASSVEM